MEAYKINSKAITKNFDIYKEVNLQNNLGSSDSYESLLLEPALNTCNIHANNINILPGISGAVIQKDSIIGTNPITYAPLNISASITTMNINNPIELKYFCNLFID